MSEADRRKYKVREAKGSIRLKSKGVQVLESRKAWAGLIGMGATAALWWMGEIDGVRAVEAMTWVLGIFIGSVALEDGMARLFASLSGTGTEATGREVSVKAEAIKSETSEKTNLSLK